MSEPELEDAVWSILIREALEEADAVPPDVLAAARAAFTWRTIDAELAEITFDSQRDDASVTAARSNQAALRALTFASSSFVIELEVRTDELLGQLVPPADQDSRFTLTMMDAESPTELAVDDMGCFTISPIPSRPFRLQLTGTASVATDWITL